MKGINVFGLKRAPLVIGLQLAALALAALAFAGEGNYMHHAGGTMKGISVFGLKRAPLVIGLQLCCAGAGGAGLCR